MASPPFDGLLIDTDKQSTVLNAPSTATVVPVLPFHTLLGQSSVGNLQWDPCHGPLTFILMKQPRIAAPLK
ncbi:unnamed protein product [Calypogeia fissa]